MSQAADDYLSVPLPLTHIDEGEIAELSEGISSALSRIGMKGMALDRALSAGFRAAVVEIQAARKLDEQRLTNIREVQ